MDYGYAERRKNKNDKRAKSRFNKFKQGGKFRSSTVKESSGTQGNKDN